MSLSPTILSLERLRKQGWLVDICERWVPSGPNAGVRKDLFGLVDLVAVKGNQTLGVQTTVASGFNARVNKMTDEYHVQKVAALQAAGWTIVVWGWRKSTNRGTACTHGHQRCGCRWTLHREATL